MKPSFPPVLLRSRSYVLHTINIKGSFLFSIAEGDPFDFDASADVTCHITVR